jgi:hypothetical protein
MRRVELYLAWPREHKRRAAKWRKHARNEVSFGNGVVVAGLLIPDTRYLIPEGPTVMGSSD